MREILYEWDRKCPCIASVADFCIVVDPEYDDGRLTNCNWGEAPLFP